METGKRYLVKKVERDGNKTPILEWMVIEVSDIAVKVRNEIKEAYVSFYNSTEPCWVLKTKIDRIGQTEFQILEDLK